MDEAIRQLIAARHCEKEQARYYRALAVEAEQAGNDEDFEALNGLLADEQHHLARIMVRLVELGVTVEEPKLSAPSFSYPEWRGPARARESEEIARYERLLREPLDSETAETVSSILETERQHVKHLGGKYTEA